MKFHLGTELLERCKESQSPISLCMKYREKELFEASEPSVQSKMLDYYQVMKRSALSGIEDTPASMGGFLKGQAAKVMEHVTTQRPASGELTGRAVAYAMAVLEVNASMGLIVAAPTAGASGVIPGSFLAVQQAYGFSDEKMVKGLFTAGAVGFLIMRGASVSGAECGCQAEVGSAAAMAAAGLTEVLGGTPEQCLDAAAFALSNVMGLVCDPVAGLVEVPCHSRNAIGASNALLSADIALSGVTSPIFFDEVVEAMYRVGLSIPYELRETALGGIAATPTAQEYQRKNKEKKTF